MYIVKLYIIVNKYVSSLLSMKLIISKQKCEYTCFSQRVSDLLSPGSLKGFEKKKRSKYVVEVRVWIKNTHFLRVHCNYLRCLASVNFLQARTEQGSELILCKELKNYSTYLYHKVGLLHYSSLHYIFAVF